MGSGAVSTACLDEALARHGFLTGFNGSASAVFCLPAAVAAATFPGLRPAAGPDRDAACLDVSVEWNPHPPHALAQVLVGGEQLTEALRRLGLEAEERLAESIAMQDFCDATPVLATIIAALLESARGGTPPQD